MGVARGDTRDCAVPAYDHARRFPHVCRHDKLRRCRLDQRSKRLPLQSRRSVDRTPLAGHSYFISTCSPRSSRRSRIHQLRTRRLSGQSVRARCAPNAASGSERTRLRSADRFGVLGTTRGISVRDRNEKGPAAQDAARKRRYRCMGRTISPGVSWHCKARRWR